MIGFEKGPSTAAKRRLAQMAAAATLAAGALVPAAAPASSAAPAHTEAAIPASATAAASYPQLALEALDLVVKGDFTTLTTRFHSSLKKELSADAVSKAWTDYQAQLGTYQSHGDPTQVTSGRSFVTNVQLRMAKQDGEFRVVFDTNGRITGLWFLRTGVPVP